MGMTNCHRRALCPGLLCALVAWLGGAFAAWAAVEGVAPTLYQRFNKIIGSAESTGNTLMIDSHGRCANVNDTLLPQSEALIRTVPQGAELLGAYLFWSGSIAPSGVDRTADFTVADGTVFREVLADECRTVARLGGHFYCRKDVTSLVRPHPGPQSYNGAYLVGNVTAQPGICDPNGQCITDPHCQARYAGWSLVLVWRDPLGATARDVILYDGFLNLDETADSAGIATFTINGFQVGNPAVGEIAFFGLEGDASLGVPPQDTNPDPNIRCATCYDYFQVNGTRLTDQYGWPNNLFNSSTANGVDLDKFNIGVGGFNLLRPGDTAMSIEVGSGDGRVSGLPEPGGGGESFFLGWVLLTLDTLAPNFQRSRTFKSVDPQSAAPGDVLQYQIVVTNEGSMAATNVIIQDAIPAYTTYVAGSTRIDNGPPLADVGGTSPLVGGLNLGTIDFRGDNDRQVTFRVRVNGPLPPGVTEIVNVATVRSDQTGPRELRAVATVVQQSANLGQPSKAAVPLGGAQLKPSDTILYTVTLPNVGQRAAQGVQYVDDLPHWVRNFRLVSLNAGPEASWTFAAPPAGSNGRGQLTVSNITVQPGSAATLSYSVNVDSVLEFQAGGVPLPEIDGKEIVNQGRVTAPFLSSPLMTDDPNTPLSPDPTRLVISYAPRLTSQKLVTDTNGAPLEPGDTLGYEIRLTNSGNLRATLALTDDLPVSVGSFTLGSCPAGANCTFANGRLTVTNLVVAEGGGTVSIPFTVRVQDPIAHNTPVQNCASYTVAEAPRQNGNVCSATLTVVATPILSSSTKAVQDHNGGDVEPGDVLLYTLVVKNTGNQPASDVVVTDPIDVNLEAVSPGQGGLLAGGTLTWSSATTPALLRIERGAQVTLTFTARVKAEVRSGTVISNQARIASTEVPGPTLTDDPATPQANDPTRVTVLTVPRFSASTKTVRDENGGPVEPGDLLTYTLTVRNTGRGSALDVVVVDPIDTAALTAIVPGQGGTFGGNQITWDRNTTPALALLAAGASITLTFQARVVTPLENGRVISNQGRITSREVTTAELTDDPTTPAVGDPTRVVVTSSPNLTTSTKTVLDQNGGVAQPGDRLTYTLTLKNTGNAPARGVVVTDVVDPNLTTVTPGQGGRFDPGSRTLTWDSASTPGLARVVPGTDVVLTFTAAIAAGVADGTVISNQGRITSGDLPGPAVTDDPTTPAVSDPTRLTVLSRPDFVTSPKTFVDQNGGEHRPGDLLTWTIAVVNSGASAGTLVSVTDVVDPSLTDIVPGQGGQYDPGTRTVTWNATTTPALARVNPGARVDLSFTSRIVTPLDNGTVIANQGFVRSAENDAPQPTDDPTTPERGDPTRLTVTSAADLTGSTKTVEDLNGGAVKPNDVLRYTLSVVNRGTAAALNVTVTDVVDANLTNVTVQNAGRFDPATRTLTWDPATTPALARVLPGDAHKVVLVFTAQVKAGLDNGTVIANQGRLTAPGLPQPVWTDDPRTAEAGDPTRVTVVSGADLTGTTKAVTDQNGGSVEPGDALLYTLTIPNAGDGPAVNVVVTDVVDRSLVDVSPSAGGVFQPATRTITWQAPGVPALARIEAGQQAVVTFTARVASPLDNGTVISNQASVTAQGLASPILSDDPATPALDDPTRVTVVARVGLTATKTVTDENGGEVTPGDSLLYTLTLQNTGNAPARNVVVTDPLDRNLRLAEVLDGGQYQNGVLTWNRQGNAALAVLNPGTPVTLRFRATVANPTANGTVVANQARVAADGVTAVLSDDPATPTPNDPTRVTVRSAPNLARSTKAVTDLNGGTVEPGDELLYVLTVRNDGTDVARDITVTDVVDPNLTGVSPEDGGTYDAASRTLTWSAAGNRALALLSTNEQVVLRFRARVASPLDNGTVIKNQGRITSPSVPQPVWTDNPATPAPADSTDVVVVSSPVFSETTKAVVDENGGLVRPGDRLVYTLVVKNTGKAVAHEVVVRDPVPTSLGTLEAGQGGRLMGDHLRWDSTTTPALAQMAPGSSVTLSFRATILPTTPNGTTITNQALVSSREVTTAVGSDDPATPARGDPTSIQVSFPTLSLSTKDFRDENGGDVNPGDWLTYTLLVRNTGTRGATHVVVTDVLDPNLVEAQPGERGILANRTVTWTPQTTPALASIPAGGSVTLTLRARVKELLRHGTIIRNQGQIAHADEPGLIPTDNPRTPEVPGDSTDITVVAAPDFRETYKSVTDENGGDVQPGDFLTYTLRVRNTGTTFAANVVVTDELNAALTEIVPGQGGRLEGRTLTWNGQSTPALAQVNPATEVVLTFRARVAAGTAHGTRISNQAFVRSDEVTTPVPSDDPATPAVDDPTVVTVVATPVFTETTKSVRDDNGGLVEVGDILTYTIVVKNTGARDGEAVVLTDPVPAGTAYVAGSTRLNGQEVSDGPNGLSPLAAAQRRPGWSVSVRTRS
jgi:uncharacterized repeat protein (TIGR01451 family)